MNCIFSIGGDFEQSKGCFGPIRICKQNWPLADT